MVKVCCVDDSDLCPNSPSCSMVLRSACLHPKHSRVSPTLSVNRNSAINQHTKRFLNVNERIVVTNSVFSATETSHHSLTTSNNVFNGGGHHKEFTESFSGVAESESLNEKRSSASKIMARTYRRKSTSSKSQYSSEDEDDISVDKIIRIRPIGLSESAINGRAAVRRAEDVQGDLNYTQNSSSFLNSSHSSHSSLMDISTVQSSFNRFHSFIWRFIYSKIIQMVNCDVWLLSKIHSIGKLKSVFFILLPLLAFIIYSLSTSSFQHNTESSFVVEEIHSPNILSDTKEYYQSLNIGSYYQSSMDWVSGISSGIFNLFGSSRRNEEKVDEDTKFFSKWHMQKSSEDFIRSQVKLALNEELKSSKYVEPSKIANYFQFEKQKLEQSFTDLFKSEIEMLLKKVEKLENISKEDKEKILADITFLRNNYKKNIDTINSKFEDLEQKYSVLEKSKNCCENQLTFKDIDAYFDKRLSSILHNIIAGDSNPNSEHYFFNQWLTSKFSSYDKLLQEMKATILQQSSQKKDVDHDFVYGAVETTVHKYVQEIKKNLTITSVPSSYDFDLDMFSDEKVKKIVKEAIMLYDADKTGQVDYALESAGGSVLGTRCTETYVEKYGQYSLFGIPVWSASNSPRTAIQPDMQPGRCWAFKGSQGFLVVELSAKIFPTGFTMEHIPLALSPTGSIDSAPKNFSVWGLESEKDVKGFLLGEFFYDISGEPLQYFRLKEASKNAYKFIQLYIENNNGNIDYTCLYRFRVHGVRSR